MAPGCCISRQLAGFEDGTRQDSIAVLAHLAVVLPGGTNDAWTAPVLLPSLALEQTGAKLERLAYGGPRALGLGLEDSRAFNDGLAQQLTEIFERHNPAKVTFVAKSRGTLFLAAMDTALVHCDIEAIWVTPLLGLDYVREGVLEKAWRSLIVAGSADPYHDPVAHAEVCAAIAAQQLTIDRANHGLVIEGDVVATAEGFRRLATASLAFAGGDASPREP